MKWLIKRRALAGVMLAVLALAGQGNAAARSDDLRQLLRENAALAPAAAISSAMLYQAPRLRAVRLAPDGSALAYLENDGDEIRLNLLDTSATTLAQQAGRRLLSPAGAIDLHWSGDSGTLFVVAPDALSAVTLANGASRKIAVLNGKLERKVLMPDAGRPQHILTTEFDAAAKLHRVLRFGADGQATMLYQGTRPVRQVLLDAHGQIAVMASKAPDGAILIERRAGAAWQTMLRCPRRDDCTLVSLAPDGRSLRLIGVPINAGDGDRSALQEIDMASGRRRIVHSDPERVSDVARIVAGRFAVHDAPSRHNIGLTPSARQTAAAIARRFPGGGIELQASTAANLLLLTERGARLQQPRHWLYRPAGGVFEPILQTQRNAAGALPEAQLGAMIALRYPASDGMPLHGYLSLPPGKPTAGLPLMTIVHGGPWMRTDASYQPLVQWLVNRGVAVFQPNFRASTGHGLRYRTPPPAAFANGRVQADITDGVRWLLAHGVGDKRRLAIMGYSFGGYATLMALGGTPQLFQFGMAIAPPPDFARTMRDLAALPEAAADLRDNGIVVGDDAALDAIAQAAPVRHIEHLTKPLLILAGGQDRLVPPAAIADYVARLQENNKPVTLLIDPDEDHNPRGARFRQASLYLLERALADYLGLTNLAGVTGTAPADAPLQAYLARHVLVDAARRPDAAPVIPVKPASSTH